MRNKNTIFKNFIKKLVKSEAFVSVMIVFVLALGIIGTSYALYMDVDTNTDYQVVQVGNLYVGFSNDGDNTVTLENMLPMEDEYALDGDVSNGTPSIYSFYLYNSGTYTAKYSIKLITSEGNEIDTKYINYIVCRDNAENCSDIKKFENESSSLVTNDELSPKKITDATNPSVYYFLKIWVDKSYISKMENTSGEKIVLKVIVESTNASGYLDNKNTLAGNILNNENIQIYNNKPNFVKNEVDNSGIYKTTDDYGISYYFRGNNEYNYVNFAGMCWRVVRIEGDGTIKLVLSSENGTCETNSLNETSAFITTSVFNSDGKINYETSEVKTILDSWSTEKFTSNDLSLMKLQENWCLGDLYNRYDDNNAIIGNSNEELNTNFNYAGYIRLNNLKKPSLECKISNNETLLVSEKINNKIGLLTADEIFIAGNNSYLNNNANGKWWTITPAKFDIRDNESVYWVDETGKLESGSPIFVNSDKNLVNIRPSITLLEDTLVSSGEGSINNPYIIK